MTNANARDWFVAMTDRPPAKSAILAFPHAGGGCAAFVTHACKMPAWLDLLTLDLPGRQASFAEPLRTELEPLVEELADACARRPDPYLLFGYCSGAVLAYCVALKLAERGAPPPSALVIGSYDPPDVDPGGSFADLDSRELWNLLLDSGAISAEMADYPELWEAMEPALRADLALAASYVAAPGPPLQVPITVLGGEKDAYHSVGSLSGWERYTTRGCQVKILPNGHWFMEEDPDGAAEALITEARAVWPGQP